MAKKKAATKPTFRDPTLGSIPSWQAVARTLGWPEREIKSIDWMLAVRTPNDDGKDSVVVFLDKRAVVMATPQRVDRGTRWERVLWGYSNWKRDIEVRDPVPVAGPHDHVWCDAHGAYCPKDLLEGHDNSQTVSMCNKHGKYHHHDDEGCVVERRRDAAIERARSFEATLEMPDGTVVTAMMGIELDHGTCDCRRAILGEHYPDCQYFLEREIDFDAMFAKPPPERVIKRKIDDVKAPKGKKRVLPGQGSLL